MSNKMTIDQAIRILDPVTSKAEVEKIRASIITDNDEDRYYATIAKVDEACVVACKIMRKWQEQEEKERMDKALSELPDYFNKEEIRELAEMWGKIGENMTEEEIAEIMSKSEEYL